MSDALVWQVVRNNNSFLRSQRGIHKKFSVEKFNLKGVNSPRYSGLANKRGIDVSAAPSKNGVVVSLKNNKGQPLKAVQSVTLTKKTLKSVRNIAKGSGFGKLNKLAQRKASAILLSQRPKKTKKHAKTEA
ncbi:unnamed protein product [Caenorhabditis auriculariae]|uniref:Large ribosomal subunit protein eL28 n=1 Tax=Caenorhabditis auriculariae TaxID=2777116 RepID=A0A8S1GVW0_9PELO|nr:unnamed protein product [Caenorhabditis auriculariae]